MQKSVKTTKGLQALFLDLVPAVPLTPLGKGAPGCDDGLSSAAAAALAETLAKRDAEVTAHSYIRHLLHVHLCKATIAGHVCLSVGAL